MNPRLMEMLADLILKLFTGSKKKVKEVTEEDKETFEKKGIEAAKKLSQQGLEEYNADRELEARLDKRMSKKKKGGKNARKK